jgi:hypothetical protein
MTFLLPVIAILLITTALTASMSLTQKAPKVKRKEDTAEKPEPSALYQGFKGPIDPILLSRIRTSFGEEAAVNFISKHQAGGPRSEIGNKSQTRRRATTERYSRDVDDDTFISYSSHSSYNSGCHDYGSSHDYGGHDCGGHDFGGFDCGSD